jgi:hypothetical protein
MRADERPGSSTGQNRVQAPLSTRRKGGALGQWSQSPVLQGRSGPGLDDLVEDFERCGTVAR